MDRLKHMKHKLIEVAEIEINENLENVDTKELGEVIDMIKDLAEAIYYCTVTEAMETKEHWASLLTGTVSSFLHSSRVLVSRIGIPLLRLVLSGVCTTVLTLRCRVGW
jgi:signal transduction histidine kinase